MLLFALQLAAAVPRIVVAPSATVVPAYDTIGVTATLYDARNRRVTTTTVTWAGTSGITVMPVAGTKGRAAVVVVDQKLADGYAVATWKRSDGTKLQDAVHVMASSPRVVQVSVYWAFRTDSAGAVVGDSIGTMLVGEAKCAYAVARDRRRGVITGKSIQWSSADTTIARIGGVTSAACADTSVDPASMFSLRGIGGSFFRSYRGR